MFRGDPGHSGYVQTSLNAATFRPAWSVPLDFSRPTNGNWREYGVTSDGTRAFITALADVNAPTDLYYVMAFNLGDGSEAWRRTLLSNAFEGVSAPSYMNGTVYVNRAGHSRATGATPANYPKLFGIDSATGTIKFETPYDAQWGENFRPIPVDNQVLAAGGYFGGFSAYNASTGAQQWFNSSTHRDPPNDEVAVDDQYVYIEGSRYNRSNGAFAGHVVVRPGEYVDNLFVAGDGQLYFSTAGSPGYGFAAYDRTTLRPTWELPTATIVQNAAVSDDTLAILLFDTLLLVDRATGSQVHAWTAPTNLWSELILTDSHAFMTDGSYIYALDIATGKTAWTAPGSGEMALAGDRLLIRSSDRLTAFYVPEPGTAAVSLLVACGTVLSRRRPVPSAFVGGRVVGRSAGGRRPGMMGR